MCLTFGVYFGENWGVKTWAPLWNGIVDSSIWDEEDYVVKIFLTMMALKDADHIVRLTAYQIGKRSRKTEQEVLSALKVLCSPDTKRREKQEYEGRRIRAVEEGWLVLNGEKYRQQVRLEMRRARNRKAQATYRANHHPTAQEKEFVKEDRNGNTSESDRLSAMGL